MVKDRRLRKSRDFERVLKQGTRRANRLLVLGTFPNDLGQTRYGFSVGRRIGKAVQRNLIKRRLRSIAGELSGREGWDIVVIARKTVSHARYIDLKLALRDLLKSAGLIERCIASPV